MFQLTKKEWDFLRCQFETTRKNELVPNRNQFDKSKHRLTLPYVFTEHGVLMTANILNSENANVVSVQIIKTFVKLRNYVFSQNSMTEQIAELRKILMLHIDNCGHNFQEHEKVIKQIVQALNNLIEKPPKTKTIGFRADKE